MGFWRNWTFVKCWYRDLGHLLTISVFFSLRRGDFRLAVGTFLWGLFTGVQGVHWLGPVGGTIHPVGGKVFENVFREFFSLRGQFVFYFTLVCEQYLLHSFQNHLVIFKTAHVQHLPWCLPARRWPPGRGGVGAGDGGVLHGGGGLLGQGGVPLPVQAGGGGRRPAVFLWWLEQITG